jgi:carboxymethylenebutenolidase
VQDLEIPADGGTLPAYRAVPSAGSGPGVLVLHEAFGLVGHIREVCNRFAREGFVALAPDLFRGERPSDLDAARACAAALELDAVSADLEASINGLLSDSAVEGSRVGVVGFCLGGHLALLAASKSQRVAAAVDFYGFHPRLKIEVEAIQGSALVIHAENDEFIPVEVVKRLEQKLEPLGSRATLIIQPGVGHAFMNDARPDRYDAVAAVEGWERMLAFLRAELQ